MLSPEYALIGAGPMGLATARQLQKHKIPFAGFELHSDVGGIWDINNPHSTMYDSAHLISSKKMTEFSEFPMSEQVATYPSHTEVREYFDQYATQFDLRKYFRFNSRVLKVEKTADQTWIVEWKDKNGVQQKEFTGVLIANGNLHTPNIPALPGNFDGEILHSSEYRHADVFKDKRVLIIGCGNSACDIAVDAVHYAKTVDISVRRGYYFLPKFALGKPIDSLGGKISLPRPLKSLVEKILIKILVGKPSNFGLPDPEYKMYESHPVINSLALHHLGHGDLKPRGDIQHLSGKAVTFSNGEKVEYDILMQATGYKLDFPFIDKSLLNWKADAPDLFLNVFNPEQPGLFIMGMVEAAGLGWQGRADQAELVASYLRLKLDNNTKLTDWFESSIQQNLDDTSGGMNYLKLSRMAYYVHKESYLKSIAKYMSKLGLQSNHA